MLAYTTKRRELRNRLFQSLPETRLPRPDPERQLRVMDGYIALCKWIPRQKPLWIRRNPLRAPLQPLIILQIPGPTQIFLTPHVVTS